MTQVDIRGVIVPDDDQWIYDWFEMAATSPKIIRDTISAANGDDLTVTINSGGGDVTSGQEIYTLLREYPGNVLIQIQSMAASAAAVISQARESEISPVAQLMIHNVSTRAEGDYRDMEHAAEVLRSSNEALANAFTAKTGKPREEILAMMDRETWLTADRAVEYGFADRIMEPKAGNGQKPLQLASSLGGLLPEKAIAYAKAHVRDNTAVARAKAEYEYMIMEGNAK
ncbi:MAG: Clp protease ClpP [Clostridiales bacterium]|nr:Clp protease ClpP [Clostridiales bacterium]